MALKNNFEPNFNWLDGKTETPHVDRLMASDLLRYEHGINDINIAIGDEQEVFDTLEIENLSKGILKNFNSLGYKADANLRNLTGGAAAVVETWSSNGSWYHKWSDGRIEQGGFLPSTAGEHTVNFFIPFNDLRYHPTKNINSNANTSPQDRSISFWNKTTTSMTTYQSAAYGIGTWKAEGY